MRSVRRSITWLVLAGFLSAQAAVWVAVHHASLEDDAACAGIDGPSLAGLDEESAFQFKETNAPSPVEHCAICHLQRAVSNARLARVVATYTAPHRISAPVEAALAAPVVVVRGSSPRGPPALIA